jgi:hypothetical protein
MAVLYLNAPRYQRTKTRFETIEKSGIDPAYGLTPKMAALPCGTRVEVIDKYPRSRRSRALGILKRVKKTGAKASWRDRYDVYIDDLKEEPFEMPPDDFDHWGVLLK